MLGGGALSCCTGPGVRKQKLQATAAVNDCATETGWLWFAVSINFPVEHFYRKLKNKADFILISSDGFQDMEPQTGSTQEKEYIKAVYCHPAYLTYMQSTS